MKTLRIALLAAICACAGWGLGWYSQSLGFGSAAFVIGCMLLFPVLWGLVLAHWIRPWLVLLSSWLFNVAILIGNQHRQALFDLQRDADAWGLIYERAVVLLFAVGIGLAGGLLSVVSARASRKASLR